MRRWSLIGGLAYGSSEANQDSMAPPPHEVSRADVYFHSLPIPMVEESEAVLRLLVNGTDYIFLAIRILFLKFINSIPSMARKDFRETQSPIIPHI